MTVTLKHVFFSGGPLSNWFPCEILYKGKTFFSSEQLFMYLKALHFDDYEAAKKILKATSPSESKQLGREVKNFSEEEWINSREELMTIALREKFKYCLEFSSLIKKNYYKQKFFVECNPNDTIWSCGYALNIAPKLPEIKWTGLNLLGKCLTNLKNEYYNS